MVALSHTAGSLPSLSPQFVGARRCNAGPYDIAKALKRDINDVRKRISELWVKK